MKRFYLFLIFTATYLTGNAQIFTQAKAEKFLQNYRDNLAMLRKEHNNGRNLPKVSFFFFGMGDRLKMVYKDGYFITLKHERLSGVGKQKQLLLFLLNI